MSDAPDLLKMLKYAGDIQEKINEEQKRLALKRYQGETGAGMVRATVSGMQEVISIEAEKEARDLGIASLLELVTGAVNNALRQARDGAKGGMMEFFQKMSGALDKK